MAKKKNRSDLLEITIMYVIIHIRLKYDVNPCYKIGRIEKLFQTPTYREVLRFIIPRLSNRYSLKGLIILYIYAINLSFNFNFMKKKISKYFKDEILNYKDPPLYKILSVII